jgi:cysteine-rich repeat protein
MRKQSLVLCLGMLGAAVGCANDRDQHTSVQTPDLGAVRLAIAVAPGLDIDSVSYSIQVPEHEEALQGTLPVGDDGMVRGKVDDVPAGEGVLVSLTASNDAGVTCSGEGSVTVRAGEISSVSVGLQCRVPEGSTTTSGSISISGTFNACPKLLAAAADPTSTETTTAVTANAEDADGDTLTFKWSAGTGEFTDAAVANTTYTCKASGEQMLSVTVDDGKGCTHSKTVTVSCTAVTPPAPVCGDSKKEGTEDCDDGNTTAGDGCSATCTIEQAPPAPVCGDNTKEGDEACDDGNTAAGDGCSPTCTVEEPPPEGTDVPCDVQAVLKAKCQNCHGQPPTAAPIPLVSLADLRADAMPPNAGTPIWQRVKVRIGSDPGPAGAMPPSYSAAGPLTDAEKATLNAWLDAGAPGATCAPPI